jgi:predicted DNA-binding mobile mystery protein A
MSVKRKARQQYQTIVDRVARHSAAIQLPPEGWLRTVRKALGMSGAQLARRMGVTRARIANAEQSEPSGSITLKSMQALAEALGCRFVYAIVPPETVDAIIVAQARSKAVALIGTASIHMALESQTLPTEKIVDEVTRLTRDIAHEMPSDLWDNA